MSFKPSRRDFIAGGVGAGLSVPLLGGQLAPRWLQAAGVTYRKLVIVQMNGGNDWINNLLNPDEPKYALARPQLKMPKNKLVRLDNTKPYYLHPKLAPFKALYDAGELAIMPGIGYPNPNLSHFRSMDVWAAADPAATAVRSGWIANFYNKAYAGSDPIEGMNIEGRLNRVFVGHPVPVLRNPATFQYRTDRFTPVDNAVEQQLLAANAKVLRQAPNSNLKFLTDALAAVPATSALIQNTGKTYKPKVAYPGSNVRETVLSRDLQLAARYITGGLTTPLYFVSLPGFDNHANEVNAADSTTGTHAGLLGALAGCIKAFIDDLKAYQKADDVVVMSTSEFGRRVGENGNLGTDHGVAGIAYLAGKPIKTGGIKSAFPSWSSVSAPYNKANFAHTLDFRRLYATILGEYWKVDPKKVLGGTFAGLGVF